MTLRLVLTVLSLVTLALSVAGCGYSEDEWKAQLAKYEKLAGEHRATQDDLTSARQRIQALEDELQKAGVDISQLNRDLESKGNEISQLSSTLDERTKALAEYRRRAEQLERIKARFVRLRKKLQALTDVGLEVKIRNNRMIISLPGDVLFESAKDDLKEEGKDVLKKVARIITADAGLRARLYQVAGHTDNVELRGGMFYDNWGLSLLRARKVLLYLIKAGKLPVRKWSAAGFADTDPIVSNASEAGRQRNRRCEIIVVPSAEEMLDLRAIAE